MTLCRFSRLIAIGGVLAFLLVASVGQEPPPAEAAFTDSDADGAIDIAEEITSSDPNNPDSTPETRDYAFFTFQPLCLDGEDNDLDGLVDTDDEGCVDTDGDVISDPVETALASDPLDGMSFPEDTRLDLILEFEEFIIGFFCGDAADNDLDGLTDAADPGCDPVASDADGFDDATEKRFGSDPNDPNSVPEHEAPNPGSCSDGLDNDLDGLTDAADPACGAPGNDDRADATAIPGLPFADGPIVMKNATVELSEPTSSCSFGGLNGTVWYRFSPPANGVLIAKAEAPGLATSVAVWRQTGSALQQVGCDSSGESDRSSVIFPATAGQTYFFQIDLFAFGDPFPTFTFSLEEGMPPPNDGYADAMPIAALPFEDMVDTEAATVEFGEPSPQCSFGSRASTVWYTFTPASDTLVVARTAGSNFDTFIGVWTDSIFGLAEIACNNDFAFAPQSAVAFEAEAGSTYSLQVGGVSYSTQGGDLVFSAEMGTPPPNNDFAGAQGIGALPFSDTVDTLTATTEGDEPRPSCLFSGDMPRSTVWYSYTAPEDEILVADTQDSQFFGTFIGVYQGSSPTDLTEVGCATPVFGPSKLGIEANAGETYYFQVGALTFFFGKGSTPAPDRRPDEPAPGEGETGGFGPTGLLTFSLDDFVVPPCPPKEFLVNDLVGDPSPFIEPAFDITSVSGGSNAQTYCLTMEFAGPIDPPGAGTSLSVGGRIDLDLDSDRGTGFSGDTQYLCFPPSDLGVEGQIALVNRTGVIAPVIHFGEGADEFGVVSVDGNSLTLTMPLSALGGDDAFNFAMALGPGYNASDCVPNGGHIHSPTPASLGDVSCDGAVNPVDASLILQLFAGIRSFLPCQHAGDVNFNGGVGPLDAVLILQLNAGIIDGFPVPLSR